MNRVQEAQGNTYNAPRGKRGGAGHDSGAGVKPGWEVKTLGEVIKLEYGKPLEKAHRNPNGEYPVYGANGEMTRADRYYCDAPSIIVGRKGSAGEINLSEPKFWPLDVTYFVTFNRERHHLRYLYYLLTSLELPKLARGVKPGINRNDVYSKRVPVPPLSEQERIVAFLDEAFAGIATAKAHAERNLQNARALFESHLNAIFTQGSQSAAEGRGEGWVETENPLSELCELIVDCEHKTAPTQDEGIPLIRTPNIGKGKLLLDGVYRVSEETYVLWTRRAEPLAGDLILAREAPAGNVAVIPDNLRVCLGQRTVLIRPCRSVFEPEFLAFVLLQPEVQSRLLAHSRGATVQHVNMKDIRALRVGSIPSLEKQREIVSFISSASIESVRLESIYKRKIAALEELKQSLLYEAFSGEV